MGRSGPAWPGGGPPPPGAARPARPRVRLDAGRSPTRYLPPPPAGSGDVSSRRPPAPLPCGRCPRRPRRAGPSDFRPGQIRRPARPARGGAQARGQTVGMRHRGPCPKLCRWARRWARRARSTLLSLPGGGFGRQADSAAMAGIQAAAGRRRLAPSKGRLGGSRPSRHSVGCGRRSARARRGWRRAAIRETAVEGPAEQALARTVQLPGPPGSAGMTAAGTAKPRNGAAAAPRPPGTHCHTVLGPAKD